ncbi:MAG: PrsW family intramembrane metalloprotease [Chloroflexi bacterium]|nr:PrsW family intramembrane metalloprotease [Chloroflexota bacterium]
MNILAVVMLGFAPGVFWLWLIYQRDRYIPAPPFLVVRTFLWGVAISLPVVIVEGLLEAAGGVTLGQGVPGDGLGLAGIAYTSFVVAGFTEEAAKFFVVHKTIFPSPYFRQPLDGVIFAAAGALGFASIENVFYMATFGPAVILVRGPFSTLAHVFFSVTWGYTLGLRKQRKGWPSLVALSVLSAMFLHGLFDFLLFLADPQYGVWAFALFAASAGLFLWLIGKARRESPFRNKVASLLVACTACSQRLGLDAGFCTACGSPLRQAKVAGPFYCGGCLQPAAAGRHFCTACGSRLERRRPIGV